MQRSKMQCYSMTYGFSEAMPFSPRALVTPGDSSEVAAETPSEVLSSEAAASSTDAPVRLCPVLETRFRPLMSRLLNLDRSDDFFGALTEHWALKPGSLPDASFRRMQP